MESKLIESRIKSLLDYIEQGKSSVLKAQNKDLLVFSGITGSGKSTSINFLNGCEIERVLLDYKRVYQVKSTSPIPALTTIGHSKKSQTFIPEIVEGNGNIFVDFPGNMDNRGPEINIANAINNKGVLTAAKTVKFIFLLESNNVIAKRSAGEQQFLKFLIDLFGSKEKLLENKNSFLVSISHINNRNPDYDDLDQFIKANFTENEIYDRITTFDPLNVPLSGGKTRDELLQFIKIMSPISNCKELFKTVLIEGDLIFLTEVSREISKRIEVCLGKDRKNLTLEDFKESAKNLNYLRSLNVIEHKEVQMLLETNCNLIKKGLEDVSTEFILLCTEENFVKAEQVLNKLQAAVDQFKDYTDISEKIDMKEKRDFKEKKYKEKINNLRAKFQNNVNNYYSFCNSYAFSNADAIYSELQKDSQLKDYNLMVEIDFYSMKNYQSQKQCEKENAESRRRQQIVDLQNEIEKKKKRDR